MRVGSNKWRKESISRRSRASDAVVSALFFSKEETAADFGKRRFGEVMGVEERL